MQVVTYFKLNVNFFFFFYFPETGLNTLVIGSHRRKLGGEGWATAPSKI